MMRYIILNNPFLKIWRSAMLGRCRLKRILKHTTIYAHPK